MGVQRLPHESDEAYQARVEHLERSGNGRSLPADPWAHRSAGMRCHTCMSFVPKSGEAPMDDGDARGRLGRCRKHAPTMQGFPAVFEADWCGDHKLDEDKL